MTDRTWQSANGEQAPQPQRASVPARTTHTTPAEQHIRGLAADMLAARRASNTAEYNRLADGLTPDERRQVIDLLARELTDRALNGILGHTSTDAPAGGDQ